MARMLNSRSLITGVQVPDGIHRAQVTGAEYKLTSNGRPMYKVILTATDGQWKGALITWRLVEVREYPKLLHTFFRSLAVCGVDISEYAQATRPEDVVRRIIKTQALLDVSLRTSASGWSNVQDFRSAVTI